MTAPRRFGRVGGFVLAMALLTLSLVSCQAAKNQLRFDRPAELNAQDYRDALAPMPPPPADASPAPEFQPVLSTPQELRMPTALVTVSVQQTVGLRDILWQLAQQAGVDIELDPQIHGSINFTAKDRPFDEVVQRICEMALLSCKFQNNVLGVKLDRPYVKNYNVGFLNVERKGDSKLTVSSSSSSGTVSNKEEPDLWKELHDGLEQVLTSSDTVISLATLADPVAIPVNPSPPPMPVAEPNAPPPPPPAPGSPQVAPMPAAAAPTLNITTPPAEPLVPNPPATESISKQTGTVSVFATERQHKLVQRFLDEFRKRVTTQVLIEAKVLQVDLNDEFVTGIDWNTFNLTGLLTVSQTFAFPGATNNSTNGFGLTFKPGDGFQAAIRALNIFGTVRALSSPRVTVMNNTPAIVNVSQDHVYFNFTASVTPSTTAGVAPTVAITSTQKNAPDGVILTVVPNANPDTGEIMIAVRPTVSRLLDRVPDPTVPLTLALNGLPTPAGLNNLIPEISVQEVDSMLHMQSGQMMALGGLMKDQNNVTEEGIPIAKDLPIVGSLFKNHSDLVHKSELVILLRAVVIGGSNVDDMERKQYQVFSLDRHPANL